MASNLTSYNHLYLSLEGWIDTKNEAIRIAAYYHTMTKVKRSDTLRPPFPPYFSCPPRPDSLVCLRPRSAPSSLD